MKICWFDLTCGHWDDFCNKIVYVGGHLYQNDLYDGVSNLKLLMGWILQISLYTMTRFSKITFTIIFYHNIYRNINKYMDFIIRELFKTSLYNCLHISKINILEVIHSHNSKGESTKHWNTAGWKRAIIVSFITGSG